MTAPVRTIHDAVTRRVCPMVRGASAAAGSMSGLAASRLGTSDRSAGQAAGGNLALAAVAALNAVAGDHFGPGRAPLAIKMAVRTGEQDIDLLTEDLTAAFPQPTARLAVFVHGLAENDRSWHRNAAAYLPYGPRMHADFGYTPAYLRYSTGRHVSENGHDLAGLLDQLVASWPVPVDDLMLVGHSMGSLVIRSACHYGAQASAPWAQRLRQVFYLGSPHLGVPPAPAAPGAGLNLSKTPQTTPFVTQVNGSSSGLRDLRYGYLRSVDWDGCDQDSCLLDHRGDTPLLSGTGHFAIGATGAAAPARPLGAVAGDLLVQPAGAQRRRGGHQLIPFPDRRGLGGMHHFDLLNHPAVWAAMRDILDRAGR